jgi:hypothetical protein
MEISVIKAEYLGGYKLEVYFSNDKKKLVDFAMFLDTHSHPQYNNYKKK